ncbi:MAG: TIGR00266 family protein [Candidatus Aenigmarchaeota archaeon]|nr:TIGR00266 family protein [Candidatus Aenigmarchaeota archaeon]
MKFEIKYKPSYSLLVASLAKGESITAEAGAMTYMSPDVEVKTKMRSKSILESIGLAIFGGQSFWVNDFTASGGPAELAFASAPVGDIQAIDVRPGKGFIIQKSAYVASTGGVDLDVKWEGFTKGIFGQGLFMIKVGGSGQLFINTFGAIDKHTMKAGESMTVDNFHLVAFSDSCDYKVTKFGGWKETILSGEGLVTQITGPGDVYIQTKNMREFVNWLWELLGPMVASKASRGGASFGATFGNSKAR